MGLLFDMLLSTSLIPFLHCPIMQAVCIQSVPGGNVTILEGYSIGHCKQNSTCARVLYRTVSEIELFHSTGVWFWRPKLSFTHAMLHRFRFFYGVE